jgi:di/tricarboxylate transporter
MVVGSLASNRIGMDVAILGGLIMLMLGGVVNFADATAGFASPAVLMLAGLFVIAKGIERTGAIRQFAGRVLGCPTSIRTAQLRLMVPVSLLSGIMNNTPIVAICIPIVRNWSRRLKISPSHLFMPLSFAAILGGKLTLIGTATNIIVVEEWVGWAERTGAAAPTPLMQFLGVAFIGLPCLVVGVAFILLAAPKLLPIRKIAADEKLDARQYQVALVVMKGSPVIGRTIEAAGLRSLPGLFLSGIERAGMPVPAVEPGVVLLEDDRLCFVGLLDSVLDLRRIRGLESADEQTKKLEVTGSTRTLAEAVVSANSPLVGKTVRQSGFRGRYNAVILAVHRQGQQIAAKIGDITLKPGDTLLLETHLNFRTMWRQSSEFFLISDVPGGEPTRHRLAPVALAIMAILIGLLIWAPIDRVAAVWGCALAMVVTRCATGTEAREGLDWKVLLVIAGAIGIGNALVNTGLAGEAGGWLAMIGADWGIATMLFVVFMTGAILSQFITNYAAAALLFPVGMTIATMLGIAATPIVFVLMLGVGCSFISPIGYQTNLMVYGPGGYRFLDYARLGVPLTILLGVVSAVLAPVVYGL